MPMDNRTMRPKDTASTDQPVQLRAENNRIITAEDGRQIAAE